jgi:hypothetical protein
MPQKRHGASSAASERACTTSSTSFTGSPFWSCSGRVVLAKASVALKAKSNKKIAFFMMWVILMPTLGRDFRLAPVSRDKIIGKDSEKNRQYWRLVCQIWRLVRQIWRLCLHRAAPIVRCAHGLLHIGRLTAFRPRCRPTVSGGARPLIFKIRQEKTAHCCCIPSSTTWRCTKMGSLLTCTTLLSSKVEPSS